MLPEIQRGQAYYHLVESYRKDGKVKQRTLLSLGRAEEGRLEKLAESIREDNGKLRRFGYSKEMRNDCTHIRVVITFSILKLTSLSII